MDLQLNVGTRAAAKRQVTLSLPWPWRERASQVAVERGLGLPSHLTCCEGPGPGLCVTGLQTDSHLQMQG